MTPTAESHGCKFSKVAFFVATFVHVLGTVLLFMFDGGQLEIGFWLWNPLPMAILRMLHHPFSSEAAYSIYFSWSVVVGLWFGFCGSLKPRSPDQFRPYEY